MINTQARRRRRAPARAVAAPAGGENDELKAILDTATDGVLVLDRAGRVLSANRSAEALFGYDAERVRRAVVRRPVRAGKPARGARLSRSARARRGARRARSPGARSIGRVRQGGLVPLYMTMGRIDDGEKLCAVLRDITAWKRTEEELINAKRAGRAAPRPRSRNSSPRSATRSARRSTPSSASPR